MRPEASAVAIKIPKTQTTLSGATGTGAKVAWAGLGMVASLGARRSTASSPTARAG